MKNILKTGLLALTLATACSFTTLDKISAAELPREEPLTIQQRDEINDQIEAWREIVHADDKDFEGFGNLTLLYYAKGDYNNAYKMAVKAAHLYEKYEINDQDDLVREAMVKGGASAYKLGKYKAAEKMLTNMLGYDLRGSKEHKDNYEGMAYYYLAALSKDEGDYNQSRTYINNAVYLCPHNRYFLDFLDGFFWLHDHWFWRHSHVHYVTYVMPHHHHHYRPSRPPMHRPAPPPRVYHPSYRPGPKREDIHRPGVQRPGVQRPNVQRPSDHRPGVQKPGGRPVADHGPVLHKNGGREVRPESTPTGSVNKPQARPQQRPAGWRTAQRPQQRPEGWRPAQRPQQPAQGQQMQRPQQQQAPRPAVQRPQQQQAPRPAVQRPQQQQAPRPAVQRPQQQQAPRPVYKQAPRPAPKAQPSSRPAPKQQDPQEWQRHRR